MAPHLRAGAILSTNTSGLSVNEIAEALPEALRPRFLVTHFFNPPRYMRLVEVVPSRFTDPAVAAGMAGFIAQRLGKGDRPRQGHARTSSPTASASSPCATPSTTWWSSA